MSTVAGRKLVGHLLYQLADFLRRVRAKRGALYRAGGTNDNERRLIVDAVALRELPPFGGIAVHLDELDFGTELGLQVRPNWPDTFAVRSPIGVDPIHNRLAGRSTKSES